MQKYLLVLEDHSGHQRFLDSYDLEEMAEVLAKEDFKYYYVFEVIGRTLVQPKPQAAHLDVLKQAIAEMRRYKSLGELGNA